MLRTICFFACLSMGTMAFGLTSDPEEILRGDADNSGSVTMADATYITEWLVYDGLEPDCTDAADANDDGNIDLSDPSYIYSYLNSNGPPPPDPGTSCGEDPTYDFLDCGLSYC